MQVSPARATHEKSQNPSQIETEPFTITINDEESDSLDLSGSDPVIPAESSTERSQSRGLGILEAKNMPSNPNLDPRSANRILPHSVLHQRLKGFSVSNNSKKLNNNLLPATKSTKLISSGNEVPLPYATNKNGGPRPFVPSTQYSAKKANSSSSFSNMYFTNAMPNKSLQQSHRPHEHKANKYADSSIVVIDDEQPVEINTKPHAEFPSKRANPTSNTKDENSFYRKRSERDVEIIDLDKDDNFYEVSMGNLNKEHDSQVFGSGQSVPAKPLSIDSSQSANKKVGNGDSYNMSSTNTSNLARGAQKKAGASRLNYEDKIQNLNNLPFHQGSIASDPLRLANVNSRALTENMRAAQNAPFGARYNPLSPDPLCQMPNLSVGNSLVNNQLAMWLLHAQPHLYLNQILCAESLRSMQHNPQQLLAHFAQQSQPSMLPKPPSQLPEHLIRKSVGGTPVLSEPSCEKLIDESKPTNIIHIIDDGGSDKMESDQEAIIINDPDAHAAYKKNNSTRHDQSKVKSQKEALQTKQAEKHTKTTQPKLAQKSESTAESTQSKRNYSFRRGLKKTIAESKPAVTTEKEDQSSALDGNLGLPKKKLKQIPKKQQITPILSSYLSERAAPRLRRKNRLQMMTDERDHLVNEFKTLENINDDDEMDEETNELGMDSPFGSDYGSNRVTRRLVNVGKKKTRVGKTHQAAIPELELNHARGLQPRRFKCVWNPDDLNEGKLDEFMSSVKNVLNSEHFHQDFIVRLLKKNNLDCEKTISILETNGDFFSAMFKITKHALPSAGRKALQSNIDN